MELKQILRQDFTLYVRPHFEKSECEVCGSCTEHLHVHHMTHFQDLLNETLEQLHLEYHEDVDMYSDEELKLIRDIMIGKQMRIKYVTCCEPCHLKLHDGSFKKIGQKQQRQRKYKTELQDFTEDELKEISDKADKLIEKCSKDNFVFKGKDGLNKIAEELQLGKRSKKQGKYIGICTSMKSINDTFQELQLPYIIELCRYSYRENNKVKGFRYYTLKKLMAEG